MDYTKYQDFIIANWKDRNQLRALLGQECHQSFSFNWGDVPTNKAEVEVSSEKKISRVRTYSGFSWTARHGYGSMTCDVS